MMVFLGSFLTATR